MSENEGEAPGELRVTVMRRGMRGMRRTRRLTRVMSVATVTMIYPH
jgi:hypothetical protein